jgi:hypothetical protein
MRTVRPIVVYTWTEIYKKLMMDNTIEKFTQYLKRRKDHADRLGEGQCPRKCCMERVLGLVQAFSCVMCKNEKGCSLLLHVVLEGKEIRH